MNEVTGSLPVHNLLESVDIGVSDGLDTTEEESDHKKKCSHCIWCFDTVTIPVALNHRSEVREEVYIYLERKQNTGCRLLTSFIETDD